MSFTMRFQSLQYRFDLNAAGVNPLAQTVAARYPAHFQLHRFSSSLPGGYRRGARMSRSQGLFESSSVTDILFQIHGYNPAD
jgi:hypothetical protein